MRLTDDETRTLLAESLRDDGLASHRLATGIYEELREIAQRCLHSDRLAQSLRATELVHEAYLRLADHPQLDALSRTRFLIVSAGEMRRVLIDHARQRDSLKRGGDWKRITLAEGVMSDHARDVDAASLGEALERLGQLDSRQLQVVELRFFAGMSMPEVADAMGVSLSTVEDSWYAARAWLRRALAEPPHSP